MRWHSKPHKQSGLEHVLVLWFKLPFSQGYGWRKNEDLKNEDEGQNEKYISIVPVRRDILVFNKHSSNMDKTTFQCCSREDVYYNFNLRDSRAIPTYLISCIWRSIEAPLYSTLLQSSSDISKHRELCPPTVLFPMLMDREMSTWRRGCSKRAWTMRE